MQRLLRLSETPSSDHDLAAKDEKPNPASEPPLSQAANELMELINRESDSALKGVVEIRQEIEPGVTHFFPRLQYAGSPLAIKTRAFRDAIKQLTAHGFLHPPENNESTNTVTYEFQDKHDCNST